MSTPSRAATPVDRRLPSLFGDAGVEVVEGRLPPDVRITSLAADSGSVERGSCFVAVRGVDVDGHDFVGPAASAGAAAIVVDRDVAVPEGVVRIRVEDTREALARLASAYYGLRGGTSTLPRLVGITGTNGKTTVAWLLRSILHAAHQPTALIGTIEYDLLNQRCAAPLTTPGPLDLCRHLAHARDAGATFAVLEVSSHALDQRRCDGLSFSAGVFTNLSGDHLDYHRSMEAYAAAKRRMFDLLAEDAVAVVNLDDAMGRALAEELVGPVVSFGLGTSCADVTARIEAMDRTGSRLALRSRTFETSVRCALLGEHNVSNALAAVATAEALGIEADAICTGLASLPAVPGRLQRAEAPGLPFSVLVDYAHTDAALAHTLRAVRPLTPGRLICVFGCGGDRDRSKRPRMAAAVGELADIAYVTSDNPRTEDPTGIIDDILPGFGPSPACRVEVVVDRRSAIQTAIAEARPNDTVLIAGKGHETYQLVGNKVLAFDDLKVASECLNRATGVGPPTARASTPTGPPSPPCLQDRETGHPTCLT